MPATNAALANSDVHTEVVGKAAVLATPTAKRYRTPSEKGGGGAAADSRSTEPLGAFPPVSSQRTGVFTTCSPSVRDPVWLAYERSASLHDGVENTPCRAVHQHSPLSLRSSCPQSRT